MFILIKMLFILNLESEVERLHAAIQKQRSNSSSQQLSIQQLASLLNVKVCEHKVLQIK